MDSKKNEFQNATPDVELNKQLEGNDKFPGEEDGKGELVTPDALKGKSVDEDPAEEKGKPLPIEKK